LIPASPGGGRFAGISCAPRLAGPLGSLLPNSDPFGEPGQVGTGSDEQRRLKCRPLPLVPVFAGVEAKCYPCPFGEQVATAVRDMPQLGDRGLDVERFPARLPGGCAGDPGDGDPVRVGPAAPGGVT
jgi:hypothetical protein